MRRSPFNATLIRDNQPGGHTRTMADFRDALDPAKYPLLCACLANDTEVRANVCVAQGV